jgi:hypothetical protein
MANEFHWPFSLLSLRIDVFIGYYIKGTDLLMNAILNIKSIYNSITDKKNRLSLSER